jgi:hypothetical protein
MSVLLFPVNDYKKFTLISNCSDMVYEKITKIDQRPKRRPADRMEYL